MVIMKNGFNKILIDKNEVNKYNKLYRLKEKREMIKRDFFNKSTIFILNINIKKLIFIIDELNSEKIRKFKNNAFIISSKV